MLKWLWQRLSEIGPHVAISGRALRHFAERDVDRLLRSRILTELARADTWGVCPHCDCAIEARPIRIIDGELIAVCPSDAGEDIRLGEEEIRRFAMDADRLIEAIAISGECTGTIDRVADGLWFIGRSPQGLRLVLCPDSKTLASLGTILALKAVSGETALLVVLTSALDRATAMRLHEAGIRAVDIDAVLISGPIGTGRLATELIEMPAAEQAAPSLAPKAALKRLTISRSRRTVCLDGNLFMPSPAGFQCILGAAHKVISGQVVLTYQELYELTNRATHRDVIKEVRDQLEELGLSREACLEFLKTLHSRGVTISIPAREIEILD